MFVYIMDPDTLFNKNLKPSTALFLKSLRTFTIGLAMLRKFYLNVLLLLIIQIKYFKSEESVT